MDSDYLDQLPDVLDALGLIPRELGGVHIAAEQPITLDRAGGGTLSILVQGAFSGAISVELSLEGATGTPGTLRVALRHGEVRKLGWPVKVDAAVGEVVVQLTARLAPDTARIRPAWKLVDTWEAPPIAAAHQSGLITTYDLDTEGNEIGMMSRVRKAKGGPQALRVALVRGSAAPGERGLSDSLVWDPSMPPPMETGPLPVPTASQLSALPPLDARDLTTPEPMAPVGSRDLTTPDPVRAYAPAAPLEPGEAPATSIDMLPAGVGDDDEPTATAVSPVGRGETIQEVPFGVFDDEATATALSPVPVIPASTERSRRSPFTWRPCIECGADVNLRRAEEAGMCPQCGAAWY